MSNCNDEKHDSCFYGAYYDWYLCGNDKVETDPNDHLPFIDPDICETCEHYILRPEVNRENIRVVIKELADFVKYDLNDLERSVLYEQYLMIKKAFNLED